MLLILHIKYLSLFFYLVFFSILRITKYIFKRQLINLELLGSKLNFYIFIFLTIIYV